MREMSQTTHADARRRVQEVRSLLNQFSENEQCRKEMEEWKIKICAEPSQITGTKLPSSEMVMGKTEFEVENCQDIDRKI